MNKYIRVNVVSTTTTRTIAIILLFIAFIFRTCKDIADTMVNYQHFSDDMLWALGLSLFALIVLIAEKKHIELLLIPMIFNALSSIVTWIRSLSFSFSLPIALIIEIAFIAVFIVTLLEKIPAKILNIVAICKCIAAVYFSFIDVIMRLGIQVFQRLDNLLPLLYSVCFSLAIALVLAGAKTVKAEPYEYPKVKASATAYTCVVCGISAVMMYYGSFIVAAGREVHSYTDMSGNPVFYLLDRICPYVKTYFFMVVITLLLQFLVLPLIFSSRRASKDSK